MATRYQKPTGHDPKTCFICLGLKWTRDNGWINIKTGERVKYP